MFDHKPREREWVSWLLVMAWTATILLSVPSIRYVTDYVQSQWGDATFTYSITLLLVGSAVATLTFLLKRGGMSLAQFGWLTAILGVYIYLTFSLRSRWPAEAVHYVEYGVLSLLIYRAFSHRISDNSIYMASVLAGTLVGVLDETVQWLVPGRYFDLKDISLNFSALSLAQITIATAVRPRNISGWPRARSWQLLSHLAAALVLVLGLCHLNTPDVIAAYTTRIPALGFIRQADDVMIEYGHLYDAPDTGRFRSRFTTAELRQLDQSRSRELAGMPFNFADDQSSLEFLRAYNAIKAPFLHEAGAHLLSRNASLALAREALEPDEKRSAYTIAHHENRILEAYFGAFLRATGSLWSSQAPSEVEQESDPDTRYESRVSSHVITAYTQSQAGWFSLGAVIALLVLGQWARRRSDVQ